MNGEVNEVAINRDGSLRESSPAFASLEQAN